MIKKITLLLLLSSSAFTYGQVMVNDFEMGSEAPGNTANVPTLVVDNPSKTGINLSDKSLRINRVSVEWWRYVIINVTPDLAISSTDTKYVSMMAYCSKAPDIRISFDGTNDTSTGTNNSTSASINIYDNTKLNEWQEIVFELRNNNTSGHTFTHNSGTLFNLVIRPDIRNFNGVPPVLTPASGGDDPVYLYLDNIRVLDYNPLAATTNNWVGGNSSDITDGANWSLGVPTSTTSLVIPSGTTNPIEIGSTENLTFENLDVKDGAVLKINSGGSLIVSGNASGTLQYDRTITKDADLTKAWYSVASPVSGETLTKMQANNDLANGSGGNRIGLATYVNDGSNWNYFTTTSADAIQPGTGLIAKLDNASAGSVLSFKGNYSKGTVETTISQGTNNFNFVGNPYSSYINLGTFFTDNNAANRLSEPTIWIWDEDKNGAGLGGYVTKMSGTDAAFEIAPGQAFFVSAGSAASNKVTFTEANQSHQTDTFLKGNNSERTEVTIKTVQDDLIQDTKLYYIEGTTTGFDNGFDGGLFDGVETGLSLYTELISNNTGEKLSIQSLPNSNFEDMTVRLGLKAQANKEITFSSSSINLPEGMNVLIEDRVANTLTNLTTDNYKVTLTEKVNGAGRFFIHTSNAKALSVESTQLAGVNIYKLENNILRISGLSEGKANLSLFNILGKEVVTSSLDSKSNIDFQLPKLSSGIYIVKLNTDKGSLSKKIVLE